MNCNKKSLLTSQDETPEKQGSSLLPIYFRLKLFSLGYVCRSLFDINSIITKKIELKTISKCNINLFEHKLGIKNVEGRCMCLYFCRLQVARIYLIKIILALISYKCRR